MKTETAIPDENEQTRTFSCMQDNRDLALELARQCKKTLDIFSRDLESSIYSTKEFIQAVSDLAVRSKYSRIRILVQDPSCCVRDDHRMIGLCQRLNSYIEMRKPGYLYKDFNEAFLIADQTGLLHKRLADRFDGVVSFNSPLKAREMTRFFTEVWETAEIDPNFRRLYL